MGKISTTTLVLKYTGLTADQYEKAIIKAKMDCLGRVAENKWHFQQLLINRPINNWFLRQVKKINQEFVINTKPYLHLKKKDIKQGYETCLLRLQQYYPQALTSQVKVTKTPLNN